MSPQTALTDRDSEILEVLATRVRCLSIKQVADHWWHESQDRQRNAKARLRKLVDDGWIHSVGILARPLPELTRPLVVWEPAQAMPSFAEIAYHLKTRFSAPVVTTPIVYAIRQAASRFGGQPGRVPRRAEATHDLGLAQVFLKFLRENPARARRWIAESDLVQGRPRSPQKVPDALIRTKSGKETAIEFGGEYTKEKLTAFHEDCAERGRSYELW
jgi:hypothetical protein